jgi:uncharacterized protein (TIGR03083 family)
VVDIDFVAVIADEAARIRAAYEAEPTGRVPWSDRWSVGSVARHVGHAHHAVARVIRERPTTDFGLFDTEVFPPKGDPGFPEWSAAATRALCDALRETPLDEACWTTHPTDATVGFWYRHMAHETLIHRWDAEAGAGRVPSAIAPALAADGIDEYLTLYVPVGRQVLRSPAGPSVRITCTDAPAEWHLQLGQDGACKVTTGPVETGSMEYEVVLRGPAEGLLLGLWRRADLDVAGVLLEGDDTFIARRDELLPPL